MNFIHFKDIFYFKNNFTPLDSIHTCWMTYHSRPVWQMEKYCYLINREVWYQGIFILFFSKVKSLYLVMGSVLVKYLCPPHPNPLQLLSSWGNPYLTVRCRSLYKIDRRGGGLGGPKIVYYRELPLGLSLRTIFGPPFGLPINFVNDEITNNPTY